MARKPDQADGPAARAQLAPSDLREHALPTQAALGFHRGRTEELLKRAADTIERLNRELAESRKTGETWKQERDQLQGQLDEEKTRAELLVGEAMLDAHRAGQAIRAEAEAAAEAMRAEAAALLEPAQQEAERVLAEARAEASRRVTDAEAECVGLAAQAEQYELLATAVRRNSVEALHRALEVLGETAGETSPFGNQVAPFREPTPEQSAGSEEDRSAPPRDEYRPEPQPVEHRDPLPSLDEDRGEDGLEEHHVDSEADEGPTGPLHGAERQPAPAKDPMTRLWQNVDDRETGVEAFEAIRARLRDPRR
jgi:cell division septum initiation protein DivIVA